MSTREPEVWNGLPVRPKLWGRDHWSTLAYAFTQAGRELRHSKLRLMNERYPTRLQGGLLLARHDDYDCLVDAETAGVLVSAGTRMCPLVIFSEPGLVLGQWLVTAIDARTVRTSTLTLDEALAGSGVTLDQLADVVSHRLESL